MSNITNVLNHSALPTPDLTVANRTKADIPREATRELFSKVGYISVGLSLGSYFSYTTTALTKKILSRTTNFNLDQTRRIGNVIGGIISTSGLKYLDSSGFFNSLSTAYDAAPLATGMKIGTAVYPIIIAACEGAGILPPQSLLDLNSITFDATMLGTGVTSLLFAYDIDPVLSVAAGAFTAYQICKSSG
jgi:hypothetical protein